MEEGYELDLTYVTERIIAVSFPQDCFEETYLRNLRDVTRMLKSKHADNYLVINLSERKQELTKMNPKTLDTGWPDFHAPPLDKICSICKAIEDWLNADLLHVVVIHCRGGKGRIGVVISCFVHFTDVSASADQALDRFAMRKFYDDKVSALMTPSQKRYVWILSSLLSGSIKMNTSPLFLHCIIIHGIPHFDLAGGQCSSELLLNISCSHVGAAHRDRICIALEPAQLLKGDILVKCFHKSSRSERDVIFRVQFHTGAIQAYSLVFQKDDMEHANKDARFPDYGKVELVFSDGPERISGSERWHNGPDVTVDYMSTDSFSKWNSYQNICTSPALTLDRCSVRKNGSRSGTLSSSPDHTLSASSDSGLSSASLRTDGWPRTPQPSQQERVELKRLLSGFGLDETSRGCTATEPPLLGPPPSHENAPKECESDILDDEALASRHDLHSVDSLGTLSSSYHKSSQNSLLSDGFGADEPHVFQHAGYSTQTWVHQQQLVAAQQYLYLPEEDATEQRFHSRMQQLLPKPAGDTLLNEAVVSGVSVQSSCLSSPSVSQSQDVEKKHDEEFSSLTLDIDNSIHQLNQLILDLDPTFVPVSTKPSCFSGANTQTRQTGEITSHAAVFRADSVQYSSHSSLDTGSDMMPSTPTFPITPPTPYGNTHTHTHTHTLCVCVCVCVCVCLDLCLHVVCCCCRSADCVSFAPSSSGPSLPAPNAHSSPLSGPRARVLQQPFEEKLEALESDGELSQGSASPSGFSSPHSVSSLSIPFPSVLPSDRLTVSFVQDTSKYWYKPDIAREQAITVLKDREPGSFIVRDSHSFRGAYGLAMKVSTPPLSALQSRRGVDLSSELVRHFLIECSARGVRLKGCPNEPYFGSLSALVCQHSITPLALPCKLIIPDRDPLEDAVSASSQSITNSAAELLKQGAACNVWFLGAVEMESLTGFQAVQKATAAVLSADSLPSSTVVHFKVSSQGITLTDNQRKLFFRRHYAVNTVIFCALDPQDRKIFGFVARKAGSGLENVCHVFAEHDPEQPASAIVNFVSKVMIGSQRT
uniref:Tensin-3-like n=1 Tax=Sinocyclocheilus rhinocerous TaxID=307959 RepID=A0A673L5F7_9TELE